MKYPHDPCIRDVSETATGRIPYTISSVIQVQSNIIVRKSPYETNHKKSCRLFYTPSILNLKTHLDFIDILIDYEPYGVVLRSMVYECNGIVMLVRDLIRWIVAAKRVTAPTIREPCTVRRRNVRDFCFYLILSCGNIILINSFLLHLNVLMIQVTSIIFL